VLDTADPGADRVRSRSAATAPEQIQPGTIPDYSTFSAKKALHPHEKRGAILLRRGARIRRRPPSRLRRRWQGAAFEEDRKMKVTKTRPVHINGRPGSKIEVGVWSAEDPYRALRLNITKPAGGFSPFASLQTSDWSMNILNDAWVEEFDYVPPIATLDRMVRLAIRGGYRPPAPEDVLGRQPQDVVQRAAGMTDDELLDEFPGATVEHP
jgi:hypothetical protein